MAYMDQDKKKRIAQKLKEAMPPEWKYTLAVRHHSTIICTIRQAPVDLFRAFKPGPSFDPAKATYMRVNPYHYKSHLQDAQMLAVFDAIMQALNLENYDKSDIQSDYFDVGHYVELSIGTYDKPFVCTNAPHQPMPLAA